MDSAVAGGLLSLFSSSVAVVTASADAAARAAVETTVAVAAD